MDVKVNTFLDTLLLFNVVNTSDNCIGSTKFSATTCEEKGISILIVGRMKERMMEASRYILLILKKVVLLNMMINGR